jgi:hypothetical protein
VSESEEDPGAPALGLDPTLLAPAVEPPAATPAPGAWREKTLVVILLQSGDHVHIHIHEGAVRSPVPRGRQDAGSGVEASNVLVVLLSCGPGRFSYPVLTSLLDYSIQLLSFLFYKGLKL